MCVCVLLGYGGVKKLSAGERKERVQCPFILCNVGYEERSVERFFFGVYPSLFPSSTREIEINVVVKVSLRLLCASCNGNVD